jgi:hypothetical protein
MARFKNINWALVIVSYLTIAIVSTGSEFAHRSRIPFLWFFIYTKRFRNSLGYNCIRTLNVLKIRLRDSTMRIGCRRIADVVNRCSWCICLTQDFTLDPEDQKKFAGHGIAPIYADTHLLFISGKICKCSGQYFGERDKTRSFKLSQSSQNLVWHYVTKYTKATLSLTTLADLSGNIDKVYAWIYRYYSMPLEFFWVLGVQCEVLSQTYVSGTPIYHIGYPPATGSHGRVP